jgi:thiamine biosynthesis protein ThiS
MEIVVNGKILCCRDGLTVHGLILELELLPAAIVVERNGRFVQRSVYPTTVLTEGDSLELIGFVGGG